MEWQPIETAPKDGTIVFGWEPRATKWKIKFMAFHYQTGGGYWTNALNTGAVEPTHWMPLPLPPNVSRETQDVKSWQSVETAPKDGTYILGCGNSNGGVVVGLVRWRDECWKLPHGSEVEVISWRPISPGHQEEIVSRETQEWD